MDKIDIRFNRLYKAIALAAVISLLIPLICMFFSFPVANPNLVNPLATIFFVLLGYFLQSLYGLVTGNKRLSGTYSYEDDTANFKSAQAVVPIIIAVMIAVFMRSVLNNMLINYANTTEGAYYDQYSLVPYVGSAAIFIMIFCGIAMWFYSPVRLASIKFIFPGIAIMVIEFALSFMVSGIPGNIFTVCGMIFFSCAVILLNQVYIRKSFKGSVVSIMTPEARFFNIGLSLMFVLFAGLIFIAMSIIYTGLSVVIKIILFFILSGILRDSPNNEFQFYDTGEAAAEFNSVIFGRNADQAQQTQLVFAVFILIFFAILMFIIFRKKINLKKIFAWLHAWIENIIAFLTNAYDFNKLQKNIININYKDEEIKIQDAHIVEYSKTGSKTRTYKDFLHNMSRMKSYDEKIGYAYKTLIRMYQKMNLKIKDSDTPRQIRQKIELGVQTTEIGDITEAIELVKYAELELDKTDKAKSERVLEIICGIIKKYMY